MNPIEATAATLWSLRLGLQHQNMAARSLTRYLAVIRDFFFNLGRRLTLKCLAAAKESVVNEKDSQEEQTFRPSLLPLHDLRLLYDGEKWESTGIDPQFVVVGPWPKGWTKISLEIETEERVIGNSTLYVDSGEGYSEEESHDLGAVNQEQVSYLPPGP